MLYNLDFDSPIGIIQISSTQEIVMSISYTDKEIKEYKMDKDTPDVLIQSYTQLHEYFEGNREVFTFPYAFDGTDFQKSVWTALEQIPYGKTRSYKDIAREIRNERAVRAVGSANGKNKISIVIPCHRVNSINGTLTGYAGGLWRKEWLLQHEKRMKERTCDSDFI